MQTDVANALRRIEPGTAPDTFRAEFRFDPAMPAFAGHFPGNPLLPGVFQIEMVRAAVNARTCESHEIVRVTKAKFSRPVLPGETIIMEAALIQDAGSARVKAVLRVGQETASTISMVVRKQVHGDERQCVRARRQVLPCCYMEP